MLSTALGLLRRRFHAQPSDGGTSTGQSGRVVLIVDDDDLVRESTVAMLTQHGWSVMAAQDGAEAAWVLDRRPVDLVLTDLNMPIMGGRELAARIASTTPGLPVLFMTGDPDEAHQLETRGLGAVLTKPFLCADLLAGVQRALKTRPAAPANAVAEAAA